MSTSLSAGLPEEAQLRAQGSAKWNQFAPDVIPCWVADMDIGIPVAVRQALADGLAAGGYGYPLRSGKPPDRLLADVFARRMERRFGWLPDPDRTVVLSDLVQAVYAVIHALSRPGDGIIVQTPNYPPFRAAIATTGRRMVSWEQDHGTRPAAWSVGSLDPDAVRGARILVLCNPHNPTGRVFSRSELEAIADLALAQDLVILADEIHADLVYPGSQHIPMASLGPDVARRTITLQSATKSFNIAGLRCAVANFGSDALLQSFETALPRKLLGSVGITGIDATIAAWEQGDDWLRETLLHLEAMRDRLVATLHDMTPQLTVDTPQGTYLSWIDCSGLQLAEPAGAFFLREARIAPSFGETFHPAMGHFIRVNFATSQTILDEILSRMRTALRRRAPSTGNGGVP